MANKTIFKNRTPSLPQTDTTNNSGGSAYKMEAKHALAQLASTGCFNQTFYVKPEDQMTKVLELAKQVEPEFIAKLAVYAREKGMMKDMPAFLSAYLSTVSSDLLWSIFPRVIDNGKMIRNFVQIMRSGTVGRKSLGTAPKRMLRSWFETKSDRDVFWMSTGNDPSIGDVLKLVHPRPNTPTREALYAYLIGKQPKGELPQVVQEYERYKETRDGELPDVPFEMLTGLNLTKEGWKTLARRATWTQTRMNLNTFVRHGVFEDKEMVSLVAERLRNPELISKVKAFPYQLLVAYMNAEAGVPTEITNALQDATEIATKNVPLVSGSVVIATDVSGSMDSPVTGHRVGATSKVRCVDVAALVAASVLRVNPTSRVLPFSDDVIVTRLNPRDSIMTNARHLTNLPRGGTNCASPIAFLNREKAMVDLVIMVSDNESWRASQTNGTATLREWETLKKRCPSAKLVCIDVTPNTTIQAKDRKDIMNIGGFNDDIFNVISRFYESKTATTWVDEIEQVSL